MTDNHKAIPYQQFHMGNKNNMWEYKTYNFARPGWWRTEWRLSHSALLYTKIYNAGPWSAAQWIHSNNSTQRKPRIIFYCARLGMPSIVNEYVCDVSIQQSTHDFLFDFNRNYASILYCFEL